jgi:hypothetical protein
VDEKKEKVHVYLVSMKKDIILRSFYLLILYPSAAWRKIRREKISINHVLLYYASPFIFGAALIRLVLLFLETDWSEMVLPYFYMMLVNILLPYLIIVSGFSITLGLAKAFSLQVDIENIRRLILFGLGPYYLAVVLIALLPVIRELALISLYSFVIIWKGLTPMTRCPQQKKLPFILLISLIMISFYLLIHFLFRVFYIVVLSSSFF